MADVGKVAFDKKNTLWVGIGYEYWYNKFGNRYKADGSLKPGIKTSAPTVQLEWHF
jgi:deferrochelatase/peroxidase EfeB